ncbi:hypothetical protein [Syntrophorhabdus aromaticivorans]|uniref:hypothetical protein n=1 Tax=Syntrophorhabdus aromaticivorans TaxID=328301 RepID=UPI00040C65CF|nr:hypothetical protein [Syntrophorhabdus aromaticivorans]
MKKGRASGRWNEQQDMRRPTEGRLSGNIKAPIKLFYITTVRGKGKPFQDTKYAGPENFMAGDVKYFHVLRP